MSGSPSSFSKPFGPQRDSDSLQLDHLVVSAAMAARYEHAEADTSRSVMYPLHLLFQVKGTLRSPCASTETPAWVRLSRS